MPQPGLYRHYKGREYTVIGLGTNALTQEEVVVYSSSDGRLWVRELSDFCAQIESGHGVVPRFEYLDDDGGR